MLNTTDQVQRKKNLKEAKALTSKPVMLYNSLRTITQADNLENAVSHLELDARESTNQKHSCLCGTLHGNVSYRIKVKGGPYHVGKDCVQNRLVPHGFNAIVLGKLDAKKKKSIRSANQRKLEDLLSVSRVPEPLTYGYERLESAAEDMVGGSLLWLTTYEGAPESVRALAKDLRDPFYEPSAEEVRTILKAIGKYKAFPADLYRGVMSDFETMGRTDIADVFRAEIDAKRELTAAQVKGMTGKINYRKFRIRENQKTLNSIDFTDTLQCLLPHILSERKLRADARKQELEDVPVGISKEYCVINAAFNRWFSANDIKGVDALKVRKIAERIEPVKKLAEVVDRMTVLQRKLDYIAAEPELIAPKVLLNEDCMTTESFKHLNGISIDECVESVGQVYSSRSDVVQAQCVAGIVLQDAAYGLVRSSLAMLLVKQDLPKTVTFDELNKDDQKRVKEAKRLYETGLVVSADFDLKRMATATQYDPRVFEGQKQKLDALSHVRPEQNVAALPYAGSLKEKLERAVKEFKQYEGMHVMHWDGKTFSVAPQNVSANLPQKTDHGVTYIDGGAIGQEREFLQGLVPFAAVEADVKKVYDAAVAGKQYKQRASFGWMTRPMLDLQGITSAKEMLALPKETKELLYVTQATVSALKDRASKKMH